jgi:signal transduction histidine kinase/putative methionine-R-sulfoxide reductase with GAF domain
MVGDGARTWDTRTVSVNVGLSEPSDLALLKEQLEQERAKVRALEDIGVALGSTLDLNELLALVVTRVSQVIEADRSTLYLLDEETGELWSKVAEGEAISEIRLRVGEGLAGWVAQSGRAVNIKDAYLDKRFDSFWDKRTGYRTRSILCVPMKNHHGRILGVIQALNKRDGYFSVDDETLLGALASQAAVCVENSKLFLSVVGKNMELLETKNRLERKVRELDVLVEIANVAATAGKLDDLLEGVLARAMRAIDAEAGSILLGDDNTGDLRFRCAMGGAPEAVKRVKIKAGEGICGWVAAHGEPQIVNDVRRDDRHSRDLEDDIGYHPRNVLCVPLRWQDGGGALELLNKSRGEVDFSEDDLKLAAVIAGQVSSAIGLARARERREREERLSTIGQLLSGVLHDLKTPITVISGAVQLLVAERDEGKRQGLADRVVRQVGMINSLMRETLAFARGESTLWVRKVYLHKFFGDLEEQLAQEFRGRGMSVKLDLRDRGVAHFDQHKIQRALHNLARNAAEAFAGRPGTFTLKVDRRPTDGALIITVSDDGPGISEAIRGRLFESFATYGKVGGTGLGLAIVKKIATDHGGTIDVESRPGLTTFTLVLPEQEPDRESRPPTERSAVEA